MSDDKTKKGQADRLRVNVEEKYEVQYWTNKWHVSEQKLRDAVAKVGPLATDVERELKR